VRKSDATQPRAVTIGSATVDIITVVADRDIERVSMANATASFLLLEQGRKIEAESITIHPGGGAINSGVCLARLGFAVTPLVKLGRDINAGMVLETFAREGLSDALVRRSDTLGTGIAVMVSSHDRNATIFTFRGANTDIAPQDVPDNAFEGADIIHISGLSNQSADSYPDIVRQAGRSGALVSNNPGIRQLTSRREAFFQALADIDLLNVNRVEAEALLPALAARGMPKPDTRGMPLDAPQLAHRGLIGGGFDMALADFMSALAAAGPRFIAVTDGTEGAYLWTDGTLHYCPPLIVETAGTAGAGDSFAATLAACLARDRTPGDALRTATANAASVVRRIDTQSGLLSAECLDSELAAAPSDHRSRRLL
jgi:ribokinase